MTTMTVCPHCDSHDISRRTHKFAAPKNAPNRRYWCTGCKRGFDIPAERERPPEAESKGNLGVSDGALDAARKALNIDT